MSNFKVNNNDFLDRYITYEEVSGRNLFGWGENSFGELGLNLTAIRSSPVQVGSTTDWMSVFAGSRFSFSIKTDGSLWGWGGNSNGVLGTNNTTFVSSPIQIGTRTWKIIAPAVSFTLGIDSDESLWGWGENFYGTIGNNNTIYYSSPVQVGSLTSWKHVSTSIQSTVAVRTDGTLWCWGRNEWGQCGINNRIDYSSPVQVGTQTNWKIAFSAGKNFSYTLALKTDGTIWAWGYNGQGTLGKNNVVHYSSPVQIGAQSDWAYIAPKTEQAMAIKSNGTLWAWGYNVFGELGDNTTISKSSPIQVGAQTDWEYVTPGAFSRFSIAKKTNGTLWAWGFNNQGTTSTGWLGLSSTINRSSPVQIGELFNWKTVCTGEIHALGILYTKY